MFFLERKILPSPSKFQKRNKTDNNSSYVSSALQQLADIRKTVNERALMTDECSIFGELVTTRLRTLEEGKRQFAMYKIQSFLFEISTQSSHYYGSSSHCPTQMSTLSRSQYGYQAPCDFPTSPDLSRCSTPQSLNSEHTSSQTQW